MKQWHFFNSKWGSRCYPATISFPMLEEDKCGLSHLEFVWASSWKVWRKQEFVKIWWFIGYGIDLDSVQGKSIYNFLAADYRFIHCRGVLFGIDAFHLLCGECEGRIIYWKFAMVFFSVCLYSGAVLLAFLQQGPVQTVGHDWID